MGYRAWMVEQARALGIDGWVRNLAGGEVEALVSGEAEQLARLHEASRLGPRDARVAGIEVVDAEPGSAAGVGFRAIADGV